MILNVRVLFLMFVISTAAFSQQVTVAAPLRGGGSGYFEHFGVGFGFRHTTPNSLMFFQHGNGMSAVTPFGGFDLADASTFGISGRQRDWGWNLGFSAIQGSGYSNVSTMPSLTLPNGGFGFINDTFQRPFVFSFVPIVSQHAEFVMQQYENSANQFVHERQVKQQQDAIEFERLRQASMKAVAENIASGATKPDDPPIVLGRKPSASPQVLIRHRRVD